MVETPVFNHVMVGAVRWRHPTPTVPIVVGPGAAPTLEMGWWDYRSITGAVARAVIGAIVGPVVRAIVRSVRTLGVVRLRMGPLDAALVLALALALVVALALALVASMVLAWVTGLRVGHGGAQYTDGDSGEQGSGQLGHGKFLSSFQIRPHSPALQCSGAIQGLWVAETGRYCTVNGIFGPDAARFYRSFAPHVV